MSTTRARPDRLSGGTRREPTARAALSGTGLAALLTAVHLSIDTVSAMLGALLPSLQVRFGLSEGALAMLVAASWFSSSMTQPVFGLLSDRLSPRVVGATGAVATAALVSLVGVAPTATAVFALLLVGGLGSGAFHPAATSLTRSGRLRNPGLAVSLFAAGGTAGLAVGPVVVLFVVARFGLGATPWLMVPGVVLGILMLPLLRTPARSPQERFAARYLPRLVRGPVGLLTLTAVLSSVPSVTFASAVPLWLVDARGVATDAPLIGLTLAAYNVSAALGGITAAAASSRVERRRLIPATMAASLVPLFAIFVAEPGTPAFFAAVALAGALAHAALPLMIITAQDLAPYAMATASGLLGFALGLAGVLYAAVGQLQEMLGLAPAMAAAYLAMVPASLLAVFVLRRHPGVAGRTDGRVASTECRCAPCLCPSCTHSALKVATMERTW